VVQADDCLKRLVGYYSRTGNTKFVAEKIAKNLKADLCEILDEKNRKGKLVFLTGGYAALREKLTTIEVPRSIDDYEFIIIGSPIWAGKITPAIRTFITQNNFSKKKISLFITMGRNKTRKALSNFKKAIESHKPIAELAITDNLKNVENVEENIEYWCNELLK
jgi:flavodoxin